MHAGWLVYVDVSDDSRPALCRQTLRMVSLIQLQIVPIGVDGRPCRLDLRPPVGRGHDKRLARSCERTEHLLFQLNASWLSCPIRLIFAKIEKNHLNNHIITTTSSLFQILRIKYKISELWRYYNLSIAYLISYKILILFTLSIQVILWFLKENLIFCSHYWLMQENYNRNLCSHIWN